MSLATIKIGPQDHGRRMRLKDFDRAEVQEGYLYELSRGVITVSDVPLPRRGKVVATIRNNFVLYEQTNLNKIYGVFSGSECKILLPNFDSERHPDIAVYV